MSDPEYIIQRFARAVYPESTALALLTATEESMLTDAAERIERLQAQIMEQTNEIKRLEARVKELEDEAIHNEGVLVALREGYTEATARIKELRGALSELVEDARNEVSALQGRVGELETLHKEHLDETEV